MKPLPANISLFYMLKTSVPSTNYTFNSTSDYEDPVVNFLFAITSKTAAEYALIAIYIVLFVTIGLPIIGSLLFLILNHVAAWSIFKLYCLKYKLQHGKPGIDEDAARKTIWKWWYWVSKIWFGYELIGLEVLPPDEPVIFIVLHGATPAAIGSGNAIIAKYRQQHPYAIIDKGHANHPITRDYFKMFNWGAYSREECVKILQDGNDIAIMPGGNLELRYSDSNYNIVWGNRKGFAHVAKEAKVASTAIVPIFCINLNEAFWTPYIIQKFAQSRVAPKGFAFAWGGLPVKLTSIVGKPITYDESKTAEDIFNETLSALKELIALNQRIPGNKFCALLDRFRKIKPKTNYPNILNKVANISA
uniref:Phospholipid/glycerol acyltransferase domain-containing protein n=1 Tax=Strigamia maritima TaxID=126957 RepID=T1J2Z2_STRMM